MDREISIPRLLLKTLALFVIANLLFAALNPMAALGSISAYNWLFPGRERLPYGDDPTQSFNLSLFSFEAMFASHEIAVPRQANEFRVVLIGDSSTWGFLLRPEETLASRLNALHLVSMDGREMRFYNLGYPTLSLTKDLMVLDQAMKYQPDFIIWLVTLESFPYSKQLGSPIVQHNPERLQALVSRYNLALNLQDTGMEVPALFSRTILGQRRPLADWLRLQLLGIPWAATGVDQYYPATYERPQNDFKPDTSFHELDNSNFNRSALAWDVLMAGMKRAGRTPVLLVNEPIFISTGVNSDIHYNFFYPRWAYDAFRRMLSQSSTESNWQYLDAWNLVPPEEFTNQAIHLSPHGEDLLADRIAEALNGIK